MPRLPKIEYIRNNRCETEFSNDNIHLWECTHEDCDGVHHYFQVSPWRWEK